MYPHASSGVIGFTSSAVSPMLSWQENLGLLALSWILDWANLVGQARTWGHGNAGWPCLLQGNINPANQRERSRRGLRARGDRWEEIGKVKPVRVVGVGLKGRQGRNSGQPGACGPGCYQKNLCAAEEKVPFALDMQQSRQPEGWSSARRRSSVGYSLSNCVLAHSPRHPEACTQGHTGAQVPRKRAPLHTHALTSKSRGRMHEQGCPEASWPAKPPKAFPVWHVRLACEFGGQQLS